MLKEEKLETGKTEIRGIQTNPNVLPATSHHAAKAHLPGGEKYTSFTKWRRRILAIIAIVFIGYLAYVIAININTGGVAQAPEGPQEAQVVTDFQKSAKPNYDALKYISDTSAGTPSVENIQVGRVVTNSSEISVSYSVEVTADVKFTNSSINSTSKMRMKYAYNSLLHTWESGEITSEQSNYRPNSGPDMQKIQDDAINLLSAYDESSASTMSGATSSRKGDISKEGGEMTLILTKNGAGTNGTNLVKTMTTKVEWSELTGWVASVLRVTTTNATLESEEAKKKEDEEAKKKEEEEEQQATMELSCNSGDYVQLTGTISGTTLSTEMTRYAIDGQEVKTNSIALTGNLSAINGMTSATINGYISLVNGQVTLQIP